MIWLYSINEGEKMQGSYKGKNEILKQLVTWTWGEARTVREYQITAAALTAAQLLITDESDKAELQNLIDLSHKFIRELLSGVDED